MVPSGAPLLGAHPAEAQLSGARSSGAQPSGARSSGALWRAYGRGAPVTLVVPGLGATQAEARIPASGLSGTRVVVTLPSHGDAADAPASYWSYERIAEDVLAIANDVGATRAVGVSLGAGALIRILVEHPGRFDRCVLLLPAATHRSRDGRSAEAFGALADAVRASDDDGGARLRALVADGLPEGVGVGDYVERRAQALGRLGEALRVMPEQRPVTDGSALASVTTRVFIIGAMGDGRWAMGDGRWAMGDGRWAMGDVLHPSEIAAELADSFSGARLDILPSVAPMVTHRAELRRLVSGFVEG